MASIAYVTDQQMIEFHRLNGNTKLNFWRPSASTKKFTDFHTGDYLFFLAKGTERGKKKEKGIIGYGVFKKASQMQFQQMWRKYRTLNGYASKQELYEAIVKVSKNKTMPKVLNCLELDQVVFFQSPLYLSELNIEISNKIESYIYLDRGYENVTSIILEAANQIGIDAWSAMFHEADHNRFKHDAYFSLFTSIIEMIKPISYTKKELRIIHSWFESLQSKNILQVISNHLIEIKENEMMVYVPFLSESFEKMKEICGHVQLLQYELNTQYSESKTTVKVITYEDSPYLQYFNAYQLSYVLHQVNE